jgi:hypothetical protein
VDQSLAEPAPGAWRLALLCVATLALSGWAIALDWHERMAAAREAALIYDPSLGPHVYAGPPYVPTEQERAERYHPGEPYDSAGRNQRSARLIAEHRGFPLFSLGEEFAGYHLHGVLIPESGGDDRAFGFAYGVGTCPGGLWDRAYCSPVAVMVSPICYERPEIYARVHMPVPRATLRGGALVQRFGDGHARLWTGTVSISVRA